MTLEDMTLLADLMRGRDISQRSLAERLVQIHRELQGARAEIKRVRTEAKRRPRDHNETRIESLERRLASKERALEFSIQRQEVLRRQLSEALGGESSRPAYALIQKQAAR